MGYLSALWSVKGPAAQGWLSACTSGGLLSRFLLNLKSSQDFLECNYKKVKKFKDLLLRVVLEAKARSQTKVSEKDGRKRGQQGAGDGVVGNSVRYLTILGRPLLAQRPSYLYSRCDQ